MQTNGYAKDEHDQWWYHPPGGGPRTKASVELCARCGGEFVRSGGHKAQRFCSRLCGDLSRSKFPVAGPEFAGRTPNEKFEQDADGYWWYLGSHQRSRAKVNTCEHCSVEFLVAAPNAGKVRWCSKECWWKDSPRYQNGRIRRSSGYIVVQRPDHPAADVNGYVREHRLVMEEHLGRFLLPTETVHHKYGVKDDNRLDRLELWSSSHPAGQRIEDLVAWAREILELYG